MATANFQTAPEGFGSYLDGILPDDIALSAGAFAASMQQIRNIKAVNFEKFAQVVHSNEIATAGLPLVNGSDIPADLTLATEGHFLTARGSGPDGLYTMSDMMGCMSGLPYMWREIYQGISSLQTQKLKNIYHELFLAVTWEEATMDPVAQYTSYVVEDPPTVFTTYYHLTGVTLLTPGGGYSRGTAANPTITVAGFPDADIVGVVDTDENNAGSAGGPPGTFGRVISVDFRSGGTDQTSPPGLVEIECPPTATLPVATNGNISTSGTNTPPGTLGWTATMTAVTQAYITQSNTEITSIARKHPKEVHDLNVAWNASGTQLNIEQRSRYTALPPVPTPRDVWLNLYPQALFAFVDAIPRLAQQTLPHMQAPTLEAISDLRLTGGQSIPAKMREDRNATRLLELGVLQDNNIPGEVDEKIQQLLAANGTVPTARPGQGLPVNGIDGTTKPTWYTFPSVLVQQTSNAVVVAPTPMGFLDPNTNQFKMTPQTTQIGEFSPAKEIISVASNNPNNKNLLGPSHNGTGPAAISIVPTGTGSFLPNVVNPRPDLPINNMQTGLTNPSSSNSLNPNSAAALGSAFNALSKATGFPDFYKGVAGPNGTNIIPAGTLENAIPNVVPIAVVRAGAKLPIGPGTPIDDGGPAVPGSLGGSPETQLIPPNLQIQNTSSTLLPATLSVAEAIDETIRCNCDCWVD